MGDRLDRHMVLLAKANFVSIPHEVICYGHANIRLSRIFYNHYNTNCQYHFALNINGFDDPVCEEIDHVTNRAYTPPTIDDVFASMHSECTFNNLGQLRSIIEQYADFCTKYNFFEVKKEDALKKVVDNVYEDLIDNLTVNAKTIGISANEVRLELQTLLNDNGEKDVNV